jgi:hypothetical protein
MMLAMIVWQSPVEPVNLRAQGMTLKEIGFRLSVEGLKPKEGGVWYPSRVKGVIQTTSEETIEK